MKTNRWMLIALSLVLALAGCAQHEAEQAGEHGADHEVQPAAATELSEGLMAKLAAADLADGEADHVVKLCGGCNLGMEGKVEHALTAGDYTMHFCSGSCRESFEQDLAGSLQALVVPANAAAEDATP